MKGLKFSLLQLIICVCLILFIAFVLINAYKPSVSPTVAPQDPVVTIPFQQIKVK
jgi:uncharacterized protein (UPF0333 family)